MDPVSDPGPSTAERYRTFGLVEAPGLSPTFERWALAIADDPQILALIDELPSPKRQVNLVFAAVRAAGAPVGEYAALRDWMLRHWPEARAIAETHATQTNEPARCAVLLPILSALAQPLALLEVGASAGLCLYPDRYSYRYGDATVHPDAGPSSVLIDCAVDGPVPIPERVPEVVWRAGIDLNPLDVSSDADVSWLETLVWPEQEHRRERLRAAIAIARREPARIVRSGALEGLEALAASAPKDATLVIFHSAVLAYFPKSEREAFVELVRRLPAVWVSNEGQGVVPGVELRAADPALFVLARDGEPVAFTGGHGQSLRWL